MTLRADEVIDRRRLRRKLTFWRVAAVLLAVVAVIVAARTIVSEELSGRGVSHIAKVKIDGTITEDDELLERLAAIRDADTVKGVILSIDSPGGTTAGGEAIYEEVRLIAAKKPVVAQVGTLAASAGYMIASATDHIVARQSSIVGSIGVLIQYPDVTGLMDKIGVKLEEVKSSPLKAEPSPFNPTTEPERAMIRSMIMDSYDWFVGLVEERRSMTREQVLALADGSIFTGRQALQNKLIDELGGEREAKAWLAGKGVDGKLEIVEWKKAQSTASLFLGSSLADTVAGALGIGSGYGQLLREIGAERLFLDGLLSVWQPDKAVLGN
ncbi:MAG: signal peptide peptidase SppA [Rhizobiaceae bacterium]|nr:signal peptide peptidase SppA [Rhizobiaceae bacterium]